MRVVKGLRRQWWWLLRGWIWVVQLGEARKLHIHFVLRLWAMGDLDEVEAVLAKNRAGYGLGRCCVEQVRGCT
jgi:hypothetical protein